MQDKDKTIKYSTITHHGKTKQDKTRQNKTRHDQYKTRHYKTIQIPVENNNIARQGKHDTIYDKTILYKSNNKNNETRPYKTRQKRQYRRRQHNNNNSNIARTSTITMPKTITRQDNTIARLSRRVNAIRIAIQDKTRQTMT